MIHFYYKYITDKLKNLRQVSYKVLEDKIHMISQSDIASPLVAFMLLGQIITYIYVIANKQFNIFTPSFTTINWEFKFPPSNIWGNTLHSARWVFGTWSRSAEFRALKNAVACFGILRNFHKVQKRAEGRSTPKPHTPQNRQETETHQMRCSTE